MSYFRGGFPNVAYYIEDSNNLQSRVPFKCRVVQDAGVAFSQSLTGLVDIGRSAQLVTYVNFKYKPGSKVIWNDILFSVVSITPYIPDTVNQGFVKPKLYAEYLMVLG